MRTRSRSKKYGRPSVHTHNVDATWLESVDVHETFRGETVWQGSVQVFEITHPLATRCYAWSHGTAGGRRRFVTVLGVAPIADAKGAVQASIVAAHKKSLS